MDISTDYASLIQQMVSLTATTTSSTSSSSTSSDFGPATMVTFGTGLSVVGFRDYSNLGTSGVWQFDLAAVLSAGQPSTGLPQVTVSEERQQLEDDAVELAFEYINGGQYDDARETMEILLKENPTNSKAVYTLGYTELAARNYDEAEQLFLKAHAMDPTAGYDNDAQNARILRGSDSEVFQRATAMLRSPQHRDEGIRLLIALTERSPDDTAAHLTLGDALLDEGDGTNGLMQYNSAIRTADSNELDTIEEKLSELVADAPMAPFVRQLLGKVYLAQERWDEAVQTLTTAAGLADDPIPYERDLAKAYVGLGQERLGRGDLTGAFSALQRAKEYSPTGAEVKAALGEAYALRAEKNVQSRKYSAALTDFSQAADLLDAAGSRSVRERAARSAYALGRTVERKRIADGAEIGSEVTAYQAAYDLDSENTTYKQKLAEERNALGDQHKAAGNLKDAADAYRRAYNLYEKNATYRQNTIDALIAYGDDRVLHLSFDLAIDTYLEAFKMDQANGTSRQKLADGYNARGLDHKLWERNRDAVQDFKNALKLFPDNATYQANYDSVKAWDY